MVHLFPVKRLQHSECTRGSIQSELVVLVQQLVHNQPRYAFVIVNCADVADYAKTKGLLYSCKLQLRE